MQISSAFLTEDIMLVWVVHVRSKHFVWRHSLWSALKKSLWNGCVETVVSVKKQSPPYRELLFSKPRPQKVVVPWVSSGKNHEEHLNDLFIAESVGSCSQLWFGFFQGHTGSLNLRIFVAVTIDILIFHSQHQGFVCHWKSFVGEEKNSKHKQLSYF